MPRLIYQSHKTKLRSAPVDELDAKRRAVLEGAGWRVVEVLDEDEAPSTPSTKPPAGTTLPATFPCRDALAALNITTLEALTAAKGLNKAKGIGPKGWAAIKACLEGAA